MSKGEFTKILTRVQNILHHYLPNKASSALHAILGAAAGFALGLLPLGVVMICALYVFLYDCGYSTNCPSSSFASWYIIAGFVGSAIVGGLVGGQLRFRSNQTDQAAFRGARSGAVIGEVLFAFAYIVTLIWTTR